MHVALSPTLALHMRDQWGCCTQQCVHIMLKTHSLLCLEAMPLTHRLCSSASSPKRSSKAVWRGSHPQDPPPQLFTLSLCTEGLWACRSRRRMSWATRSGAAPLRM